MFEIVDTTNLDSRLVIVVTLHCIGGSTKTFLVRLDHLYFTLIKDKSKVSCA